MMYDQGTFVTERTGTPLRKFFLRITQAGIAFRNLFFRGIDISNTSILRPNFGSVCVPETILFRKNSTAYDDVLKLSNF
jgi:hypothetical protein